ncbi:hypothetical protein R1flu_001956 [Riccia fluitans]|uniref:Uncharacterized protein n=1 Tax=Riccia fluitans TaxID=41844 RepID=A0ABD1Y555_9MARC
MKWVVKPKLYGSAHWSSMYDTHWNAKETCSKRNNRCAPRVLQPCWARGDPTTATVRRPRITSMEDHKEDTCTLIVVAAEHGFGSIGIGESVVPLPRLSAPEAK